MICVLSKAGRKVEVLWIGGEKGDLLASLVVKVSWFDDVGSMR